MFFGSRVFIFEESPLFDEIFWAIGLSVGVVVVAAPVVVVGVVAVFLGLLCDAGALGDDAVVTLGVPCVWVVFGPADFGALVGEARAGTAVSARIAATLIGSSRSRMLVSSAALRGKRNASRGATLT